ncbi:MAG: hypothetical protein KAU01_10730 [Candidatus Cloacimonetes bacterium]|nr:hypothetical protein [Candidatus Cloacimonadota bacterium]
MRKICIVFFIIFIGFNLHAADWNITGAGARVAGMGGAFIGVADDATAITWNPGGLTQLYRPEVSVVTRYITEKYDAEYDEETYDQGHFVVNFVSAAYPLMNGKLVVALAYQKQLDMFSDWGDDTESFGGANTITPGLAYRIIPLLSIGMATNIWTGSWEEDTIDYGDYVSRSINFSGFNMNLGAMLDFSNFQNPIPLKFGFSMRTPFELEVEVDADYDYYDDMEYTNIVEMPMMMGFGASYRIGENFTVAADYEMRKYGASEIVYEDDSSVPLSDSEEDLNQFRVGGEYLVITDFAVIPLRLGYQNVPTLIADENEDQVVGTGLSFGSGLIFERFSFDVTFQISGYEYENYDWGNIKKNKSTLTFSGIFYF